MSLRRRIMGDKKRLPSTYQEVEYIQSSGVQCMDTGYGLNASTDTVTITFEPLSNTQGMLLGGGYYPNSYGEIYVGANGEGRAIFAIVSNKSNQSTISLYSSSQDLGLLGRWNTLTIENKIPTINGTSYNTIRDTNTNYNIYLNCLNRAGSKLIYGYFKFKSYIQERNGNEILNLVPCYRKSDNKPGMYNLVTDTFLTNANTGTDFTLGPKV